MEAKRLMKVTYQDLKKGIRLNAYADAVIWSEDPSPTLAGLRFGGYAEVVRGLTDAIYGGATIEIEDADGSLLTLKSLSKQYHREVSHPAMTCWICRSDGRLGEDNTAFLCRSRCRRTFSGLCPMIIQVLPSSWPHLCGTGAPLSLRGVRPCISICSRMEGTPEAKAQIEKTHFLKYGKKWGFYHDLF